VPKITKEHIQYTTNYPTPQKSTETKQHTKPAHTTYHIPSTSEKNIESVTCNDNKTMTHTRYTTTLDKRQNKKQEHVTEQEQDREQE